MSATDTPMTAAELLRLNSLRHELHDKSVPQPVDLSGLDRMTDEQKMQRCREDFAFWAATCVRIRDKRTGRDVPFRLNAPQRRVAALLEEDRRAGRPLRMIMLKARQWGGSTLIEIYMAWIQCVHRTNWNSLVCAHTKDTAASLRGMLTKLLENYPPELWDPEADPKAHPGWSVYERSANTRVINGRGCRVTLASAESQESSRGMDISMAHLSEVAFWKDTPARSGADFARAICSGILMEPLTLIVLESTANGVGNYFHTEWVRSVEGKSDKRAVFVPWYEIDLYRAPVPDPMALWQSLDDYELELWNKGEVTLEMLQWYHNKRREYPDHVLMMAEYPTTATEAFVSTSAAVFAPERVDALRAGVREPALTGEMVRSGAGLPVPVRDSAGCLKIWNFPAGYVPGSALRLPDTMAGRFIVTVDVGGRSRRSDFSVIAVMRLPYSGAENDLPEVVAQWRGHCDHDILAFKAMDIARFYNNALLVVESNTLETEWSGDSTYILERVGAAYPNLYYRPQPARPGAPAEMRPGFHTNRSTKTAAIASLIAAVREGAYTERSAEACDEMAVYEYTSSGVYAARPGFHDDVLMTRAIALYVAASLPRAADDPSGALCAAMPRW